MLFLDGWLKHWPRDQLLFLRNEDYAKFPREHLRALLDFLGEGVPARPGLAGKAAPLFLAPTQPP